MTQNMTEHIGLKLLCVLPELIVAASAVEEESVGFGASRLLHWFDEHEL